MHALLLVVGMPVNLRPPGTGYVLAAHYSATLRVSLPLTLPFGAKYVTLKDKVNIQDACCRMLISSSRGRSDSLCTTARRTIKSRRRYARRHGGPTHACDDAPAVLHWKIHPSPTRANPASVQTAVAKLSIASTSTICACPSAVERRGWPAAKIESFFGPNFPCILSRSRTLPYLHVDHRRSRIRAR